MGAGALRIEDLPHYTYDDYVQWEGKWEIIYGIPWAKAPAPGVKHQKICGEIYGQLKERLKPCNGCQVLWPLDWPIADDTVVQPDVLVVCGEDIGEVRLEVTPVLVFEVLSPSTSRKDRVLKYRLYEEAGVKYYCIVDPATNSAEVFLLKKDKYGPADEFQDARMRFDLGPCEIEFDFGAVFK